MDSILVTGGAGFVGANLALGLRARWPQAKIVALDNLKRRGSELNLPRLRAADVPFVHGDIRCPEDLEAAGPADLILECSAEPSVLAGYNASPAYVINTNLTGTLHCLEHARRCGAALVFLSTSRVYPTAALNALRLRETDTRFELEPGCGAPGASERGVTEAFPLTGARSLYGATKLCSELVIEEYAAMYGLRAVINRCGVVAGPWQMGKADQGVTVLWAARHYFGKPLRYIGFGGTGKQVRDLLHIDDLLDLVVREIDGLDALSGRVFNVGGGPEGAASLCELTALCREAAGREVEMGADPATRPADVPWYVTDNAAVTAATGWRPVRRPAAVVADIVAWLRGHEEALRPILG